MQALIFDFDGLIIDSETPEYESWRDTYREYGADLPLELWAGLIGKSVAETSFDPYAYLEEQIGQPVNRDEVRAQRRARFQDIFSQQTMLPGVRDYIDGGQRLGLKLAVATSGTRAWVEPNLARLGILDSFAAVCSFDDVQRAKPDPELYQLACQRLGVATSAAIAFEDSLNGLLAAKGAGLFAVAVPNPMTQHLDFEGADLRLNSLTDMALSDLIAHVVTR